MDALKLYAFENGHSDAINKIWGKAQKKIEENSEHKTKLERIEKGCALSMAQHLNGLTDFDSINKLYSETEKNEDNLILNALKSLQINQKDPKLVKLNSKIIN